MKREAGAHEGRVAEETAPPAAQNTGAARSGGPRPARVLTGTLWGTLLALGLFFLVSQVIVASQGPTDFCQDYLAAQHVLHGTSPYLPLHCMFGKPDFPAPQEYDPHPPFSVLLLLPFGLASPTFASALWGLISLAAYLISGRLLLGALGWRSLQAMALFTFGSLFWQPFTYGEAVQNFGPILTFLLISAWLLERQERSTWAGLALGLASLLKLWPVLLLLGALLFRKTRLGWVGLVGGIGGSALTLAVLGPSVYATYLGPVRANEAYWVANGGNISLVGAIVRPLTGYAHPPLPLPALAAGVPLQGAVLLGEGIAWLFLVIVLVLLWRCQRGEQHPAQWLLSQGVLVTTALLVFPLTWPWAIITLLLPGATTMLALRQLHPPPRWWLVLLVVSLGLCLEPGWLLAVPSWLVQRQGIGLAGAGVLLFGLPTYGLLLFVGLQAYLLWRASHSSLAFGLKQNQHYRNEE